MSSRQKAIKEQVYERDNGICGQCGMKTVAWEIHHVKKRAHGGSNELENLQTVCRNCHVKLHKHDDPLVTKDRCPICNSKHLLPIEGTPPALRCSKCKAVHPAVEIVQPVNEERTKWRYEIRRAWSQKGAAGTL